MANAEQLLNEAQYAFNSIHYGESRDNRRNAARARSLCKKIIRKFPTSTEAGSARGILRRLGDEAFSSKISEKHQHSTEHRPMRESAEKIALQDPDVQLDWSGIFKLMFKWPTISLLTVAAVFLFFNAIFGSFLLVPLVALVLFFGPLKRSLQPGQAQKVNEAIAKINAYVDAKRS
jgi:hypothetical protein